MVGSVPLDFVILPALAALPSAWTPVSSATATEKVLRELAAALESKGEIGVGLSAEFLAQIPGGPLSSLRTLYRRMLTSSAVTVSSAGLAGLLRSGDVEGLMNLKSRLSQLTSSQQGPSSAQAVCEYFNGNPRGLALLAEFAATTQSIIRLRECAAFALRNIHSRESIPFLVELLDSNNAAVRYEAVAGLASYANSGFIPNEKPLLIDDTALPRNQQSLRTSQTEENFPTLEFFRRDEARFIRFWKQWAQQNTAAVTP